MLSVVDNNVGFFKRQHAELCKVLTSNDLESFSFLETDYDRFAFMYSSTDRWKFPIRIEETNKNLETAKQLKNDGNLAFKSGDMMTALHLYNRSILKYPHDEDTKPDIAVLFANRSAVFFHQREYELCISDIQIAIEYEYPKYMRYKIFERKAKSLMALKQNKSALEAFRATFLALDDAKLSVEERKKMQMNTQIMMSMMSKDKNISDLSLSKKVEEVQLFNKENASFKTCSSSINFQENEVMGRYAKAADGIDAGKTILIEVPYSSVLIQENAQTHCFHCFKRLLTLLPCIYCCNVAFCSLQCQKAALSSHHKYECKVLMTLWASGASITCLIALRILTQKSSDYFLRLKSKLEEIPKNSEKKLYSESDYFSIYNLERHESKRTAEDLLHRSHMAVFLFKSLKATDYFQEQEKISVGKKLTEDEIFIGGLLLRHLQLLQFNVHEVSELIIPPNATIDDGKGKYLGAAIYPTLALFNHSCDPSIVRYFHGTKVIVATVKKVRKGEMIAENYGPIFTQTARKERQEILKSQYWFDCTCVPCTENWPKFDEMDSEEEMRFRCESKHCPNPIIVPTNTLEFLITCTSCKKITNIIKGLKVLQDTDSKFQEGETLFKNGNIKKALKKFIELLTILEATLVPPFKGYHLCQQAIKTCYLHLGNKFVDSKNKLK